MNMQQIMGDSNKFSHRGLITDDPYIYFLVLINLYFIVVFAISLHIHLIEERKMF